MTEIIKNEEGIDDKVRVYLLILIGLYVVFLGLVPMLFDAKSIPIVLLSVFFWFIAFIGISYKKSFGFYLARILAFFAFLGGFDFKRELILSLLTIMFSIAIFYISYKFTIEKIETKPKKEI